MHPLNHTGISPQYERFEKIYEATYHKLYGFVYRYLKDPQDVKDVLQDCYIRLWEKLHLVNNDMQIMPMLRTWAINTTTDAVRKQARTMQRDFNWQELREKNCVADDRLHLSETMRQYNAAIQSLPAQQQRVFRLIREEGLSQQETAMQLQLSIHTVKRHLQEALKSLRHKIPEHTLAGILLVAGLNARWFV
jgi:RNA polymerase sigma-70 factor (family 1)